MIKRTKNLFTNKYIHKTILEIKNMKFEFLGGIRFVVLYDNPKYMKICGGKPTLSKNSYIFLIFLFYFISTE